MAYLVIKTVKGKQYLYRQRSYRDEGKVKTVSEYVGAVSDIGPVEKRTAMTKSAMEAALIDLEQDKRLARSGKKSRKGQPTDKGSILKNNISVS